jgi:hypothetical protein
MISLQTCLKIYGAVFTTGVEKLFGCDLVSGEFLSHIDYTRAQFSERFNKNFARMIEGDYKPIEEDMKAQLFKKGECTAEYTILAKGAKRLKVKDSRYLITQQDGTMVVLGELTMNEEMKK